MYRALSLQPIESARDSPGQGARQRQEVAIKILPFCDEDLEKMRAEINFLVRLRCPYVVSYLCSYHYDHELWVSPFIRMSNCTMTYACMKLDSLTMFILFHSDSDGILLGRLSARLAQGHQADAERARDQSRRRLRHSRTISPPLQQKHAQGESASSYYVVCKNMLLVYSSPQCI